MDALYGANLTGKSVAGTLQRRMGKWFKKESLPHIHNNLNKFFTETYQLLPSHLTFLE
jgi:hypothetical protein